MTFLQLPVCLFLVVTLWVTPLCAAPAASPAPAPGLRPVTSPVLVKRDSEAPSPGLSGFTCDKSGIFADQDTGCQVSKVKYTSIFRIAYPYPESPQGLYQFACVFPWTGRTSIFHNFQTLCSAKIGSLKDSQINCNKCNVECVLFSINQPVDKSNNYGKTDVL